MLQCHLSPFRALRGTVATMLASIVMCAMIERSTAASSRLRASQLVVADDDATVPVPKAGDLVGEVKLQLEGDHRTLGKVSAVLMDVQNSVDKTEQSMLGKVLDLQTARTFFARHEEIDTSNDKMEEEVSKLSTQVEGLSSTVSRVQKAFLANAHEYQGAEGKLHGAKVEDESIISEMNAELAKGSDVKESLKKLTKIHDDLLAEGVEVLQTGKKSVIMLTKQRADNRAEVDKHKSLRSQLVAMNNYSIACHASVEKASKKLGTAMLKESKDNKATQLTATQKQKANAATEQRLLAERALLTSETTKNEKEEKEDVDRLKDLREDFRVLQTNIVAQVRALEAKINEEKERVQSLRTALMENAQAEENDLKDKGASDSQIGDLTKKLHDDENPILIATTEGENDALQSELNEAYVLFKHVKDSETTSLLNLEQAQAEVVSKTADVKNADESIKAARELGQDQVAKAVQTASDNKDASDLMVEKAQSALLAKCKTKWDFIAKTKGKKLKKCKAMEDSLVMQQAKKDVLVQALKARAETQS